MRTCNKCLNTKDIGEYRKWTVSKDGYRKTCKDCMREEERLRRLIGSKGSIYARSFRERNPAAYVITRCQQTAQRKGLEFDLHLHKDAIDARIKKGVCEVSGFPLALTAPLSRNMKRPDAASIDRIDSTKGYVYTNIRVVCLAVNLALGTWGESGVLPILSAWFGRNGGVRP